MDTALILSGGGAKGDFELGAVRYLYEVLNIHDSVKLIAGTSVGAINGGKLAEGEVSPTSGLRGLMRAWYTLDMNSDMWTYEQWVRNGPPEVLNMINGIANAHRNSQRLPASSSPLPKDNIELGGFRDLANAVTNFAFLIGAGITFGPTVASGAEASSVANINPIRNKLYGLNGVEKIFDDNLVRQWVSSKGAHLALATVSLDSGELRFVIETGELVDRKGWPIANKETNAFVKVDVREGIIASASIGVVFPPVQLGDEFYVDGGHRSVIPVDALFHGVNKHIKKAYLISASPVALAPARFATNLHIGNIGARAMMETFLAEIVRNEIEPRGGWGDRDITLIAPSFEVHSVTLIDPGMVRINADYGWMRADDSVNKRDAQSRLFQLSDKITAMRARIWFEEGRYLGLFGNVGMGDFNRLPEFRTALAALVKERQELGGSLPAKAERWAQTGEAHSTGFGSGPMINLFPIIESGCAVSSGKDGKPVVYMLESFINDSRSRNIGFNDSRAVVFSTSHNEPLIDNRSGWRIAGRSAFAHGALINSVQSGDKVTVLLGVDQDGKVVCAEQQPDGMGFSGWLPVLNGESISGGEVTGVSRNEGVLDLFVVGTDGKSYTASRFPGQASWGGWWPLPNAQFQRGAPLTAVSRSLDKLDLFGADNSGNIVTAAWAPGAPAWGGWWPINNGKTSAGGYVASVSADNDVIDIFVVGTDGNIYRSFWSASTNGWSAWMSLAAAGLSFSPGQRIAAVSPSKGIIEIACVDGQGRIFSASLQLPLRTFGGFTQIGTRTTVPHGKVSLFAGKKNETHAFMIGRDRIVYSAVHGIGRLGHARAWSDWAPISNSINDPVITPPADDSPFQNGMTMRTNDTPDLIEVKVEAVPVAPDAVEFVLEAGPGIDWEKQIVISEGPAAGTSQRTIRVINNINRDANGLFANQLPGGKLEFRKAKFLGEIRTVKEVDISKVTPGTRITFKWVRDT